MTTYGQTGDRMGELERRVSLDRIRAERAGGFETQVVARPEEWPAIAARLQVPSLAALVCRFRLTPGQHGTVDAEAWLEARLTRLCVITLEPFEAEVKEQFRLRFVPEGQLGDDDDDPDAVDELEYRGNTIDLGEAVVEQLALGLDPYPRAPGAVPAEAIGQADDAPREQGGQGDDEDAGADGSPHPFAALAARRRPD